MSADNHSKPDDDKAEPHENDKCMEDGQRRTPGMSKLRAQVTSAVSNIPSLVIVLLCVLLFVFFIIIIALAVRVHSGGSSGDAQCLSASCLGTASQVLSSLDPSRDPCRDPYALACGGAIVPLEPRESRLDASARLRRRVHHQLRHLVDLVPVEASETGAASKVKRFYETCMEPRGLTSDARAVFVHTVRQVGGWDLIRASSWSIQSWNRDTALEKLIVSHGVQPFFRISVAAPFPERPQSNVIRVSGHRQLTQPASSCFCRLLFSRDNNRRTKCRSWFPRARGSCLLRDGNPGCWVAQPAWWGLPGRSAVAALLTVHSVRSPYTGSATRFQGAVGSCSGR